VKFITTLPIAECRMLDWILLHCRLLVVACGLGNTIYDLKDIVFKFGRLGRFENLVEFIYCRLQSKKILI